MRIHQKTPWGFWLSSVVMLWFGATAVTAQESTEGATVLTRARPEYDPVGLRAGVFDVYPTLSERVLYDSNVFGTDTADESSYVFETSPRLAIQSDWNQHALELDAFAHVGRNANFSSEDYLDWQISTNGRLDLGRNSRLSGGGLIARNHVDRSAPDETRGFTPTEFGEASLFGLYDHQLGWYGIRFDARVRRRNYDDVSGLRGGHVIVINQDDRDRTEFSIGLRGQYRSHARVMPFIQISGERRDYDELQDFILADRSSTGYEISSGLEFDLGGVTSGEISAGYRVQNYREPFPDNSTPVFGAALTWHVSALTAATLNVERFIRETQSTFFSGYVSTATSLGVGHELRRNVLLNAAFTHMYDDYAGVDTSKRNDTTYDLQLGSTYMVNRYARFSIEYHYLRRDSSNRVDAETGSAQIEKNIIIVQLQVQL